MLQKDCRPCVPAMYVLYVLCGVIFLFSADVMYIRLRYSSLRYSPSCHLLTSFRCLDAWLTCWFRVQCGSLCGSLCVSLRVFPISVALKGASLRVPPNPIVYPFHCLPFPLSTLSIVIFGIHNMMINISLSAVCQSYSQVIRRLGSRLLCVH